MVVALYCKQSLRVIMSHVHILVGHHYSKCIGVEHIKACPTCLTLAMHPPSDPHPAGPTSIYAVKSAMEVIEQ